jgi:putative PIN family toxin of toxin-antitoxin system
MRRAHNVRLVIDPGVLVSALIAPRSTPGHLLETLLLQNHTIIVSETLLSELGQVLFRAKFAPYFSNSMALAFLSRISSVAERWDDPVENPRVTVDPKDDYLIALARHSVADAIVSGDRHLTQLAGVEPPVLTPRQLLDILDNAS